MLFTIQSHDRPFNVKYMYPPCMSSCNIHALLVFTQHPHHVIIYINRTLHTLLTPFLIPFRTRCTEIKLELNTLTLHLDILICGTRKMCLPCSIHPVLVYNWTYILYGLIQHLAPAHLHGLLAPCSISKINAPTAYVCAIPRPASDSHKILLLSESDTFIFHE